MRYLPVQRGQRAWNCYDSMPFYLFFKRGIVYMVADAILFPVKDPPCFY